ncbi:U32 family peptidase [Lacrimispora aerotolerans]|uniref:U32 family peptidase n=1 Tax=Lacrimispora aerotolerans TaxID=36832 RepID=UPI00047DA6D4|nr:U32 family peptidase [Lacrimispora aerotolerans]
MLKNFCISTDFLLKTISQLSELDKIKENKIKEVFGNITPSIFSSGRSELYLPKCNIEELAIYISYAHKHGIEFNYTLNGICMSNQEFDSCGYKKLLNFVSDLIDIGVDRFTISSPVLMNILSTHFKNIKITASAICQINSLSMARDYAGIGGVDRLVIFEDSTRNFQLLKKIHKELGIEMEIIVNQPCQFGCIYRNFHRIGLSHESIDESGKFKIDDYYQVCWKKKLANPSEMLKIPTIIRPEDLHHYEMAGVKYFKIVDRMIKSINIKIIESYMDESYEGNLFDILPGEFNALYLDNSEMNGFIDYFLNEKNICHIGCSNCGYCDSYAKKIIVSEERVEKKLNKVESDIRDFLEDGPKESTDSWRHILSNC